MTTKNIRLPSEFERAWNEFMSSGQDSYQIAAPGNQSIVGTVPEAGIDPYDGCSHNVLGKSEFAALLDRKRGLINTAVPFMTRVCELISETGFMVVLTDEQGFILEMSGTPELEAMFNERKMNFQPGVCWAEEDVGTNGIGAVLRLRKPFQISGAEHYASTHHSIACLAAPIFGIDGKLVGTLCAIGLTTMPHEHTVALMMAAVEVINVYEMNIRSQNRLLTNVLMSMSDGVIVTDTLGRIAQINPVAKNLLGSSLEHIEGSPISKFLDDIPAFNNDVLSIGKSYSDKEISIKTGNKRISIMASANPIKDEQDQIFGGVIVLTPAEKTQKLIRRYASAPARFQLDDIIGKSHEIRKAVEIASRASTSLSNVLLEGESGTGKEVFAQAIHNGSQRSQGPFVAINCGALPHELITAELFGYNEGAFTGAKKEGKPGKFELANGGTIFLDEIAEMPLEQQVNLLRVLQERNVIRIGGTIEIPINVRVICATNKKLLEEVKKGKFRQDLYYRLNVISIRIPPLRDRVEDIPQMFNYFLTAASDRGRGKRVKVDRAVIECLKRYDWPGNVRELQNIMERMLMFCDEERLGVEHLPLELLGLPATEIPTKAKPDEQTNFLRYTRKSIANEMIEKERSQFQLLLEQHGSNISRMAKEMGVHRSTIYRRVKRYSIVLN